MHGSVDPGATSLLGARLEPGDRHLLRRHLSRTSRSINSARCSGSISVDNDHIKDGVYTFTLPNPVTTGSPWLALTQFELHDQAFAAKAAKGGHGYMCGPRYCDELVIVAELTGRTVDRVDQFGSVHRLPVFVRELGDRFGTYKSR